MDPQICRALPLFVLFAAATHISRASNETEHKFGSAQDSLMCYECKGSGNSCVERPVICPIGFSNCMSTTTILQIGDTHMEMNQKECIEDCQDTSMNLGISKSAFSCCGTRLCNSRDAPDPRTNAPNGRTCYYCDGQSCSNTVSCSGSEDRCITATGTDRGLPTLVKGCASKHICGARKCSFIQNASCCEGDLCNGDSSVTQAVTTASYTTLMRVSIKASPRASSTASRVREPPRDSRITTFRTSPRDSRITLLNESGQNSALTVIDESAIDHRITVLRVSSRASCSSAVLCSATSCGSESSSSSDSTMRRAVENIQLMFPLC